MKFIFFVCLISLGTSASLKNEGLRCNLRQGDRVLMSGTFTGNRPRSVLTLSIRNPIGNTIAARVEVYPNAQTVLLRATTTGQRRPDLVREAVYTGGSEVKIELTVNNGGGYNVRINDMDYGMIPRITGPVPTIVETSFDINTKQLQVFSACAVHPATATTASTTPSTTTSTTPSTTPSTTTLSPAVQAATTALNDAKSKLANANRAQNTADAAAAAAVREYKQAAATAASKKALNEQAIAAIQSMSTAADSALAAAGIAVAQATAAKDAATTARDAAMTAHDAAPDADKAQTAPLLATAKTALTNAETDEMAVMAAQAQVAMATDTATTALAFARNQAAADGATNARATNEARQKATTAAAAAVTAKNEVDARTRDVEAAEVALEMAKTG